MCISSNRALREQTRLKATCTAFEGGGPLVGRAVPVGRSRPVQAMAQECGAHRMSQGDVRKAVLRVAGPLRCLRVAQHSLSLHGAGEVSARLRSWFSEAKEGELQDYG